MCRGINKNVYLRIILIGLTRCDNFICVNCDHGFAGRVLWLRCAASCCFYAVTEFIARRKERTLITRSYFYCVAYTTRAVTPRKGTSQHAANNATGNEARRCNSYTVTQLHSYSNCNSYSQQQSEEAADCDFDSQSHSQRGSAQRTKPASLSV